MDMDADHESDSRLFGLFFAFRSQELILEPWQYLSVVFFAMLIPPSFFVLHRLDFRLWRTGAYLERRFLKKSDGTLARDLDQISVIVTLFFLFLVSGPFVCLLLLGILMGLLGRYDSAVILLFGVSSALICIIGLETWRRSNWRLTKQTRYVFALVGCSYYTMNVLLSLVSAGCSYLGRSCTFVVLFVICFLEITVVRDETNHVSIKPYCSIDITKMLHLVMWCV